MSKPTRPKSDSSRKKASTAGRSKSYIRAWDLGLDWPSSDPQRPTKPFSQSDWVFICVDRIITAARSIPMNLSTPDETIVESGPAFDLLFNNPNLPFSQFLTQTVGYLALYRECYWIFLDKDILKPTRILVAGPSQVQPEIRSGVLVGYWLQTDGGPRIPLLPEDVWPILDFNPDSRTSGVGPATAGKLAISTAYQAAMLNESTLANGGKMGTIIVYPAGLRLDTDERQALLSQFEARHGGARNAGKTAIMTGGADIKTNTQSMVDLQMLDLRGFDAKTICALFGVPSEVAGLSTEAQYANGPAQQRFILNTIASLLWLFAENCTIGILQRFRFVEHAGLKSIQARSWHGKYANLRRYSHYKSAASRAVQNNSPLFAWFSLEDHPTVQEMIRSRADQVLKYTSSGLPLNAIIDAFDLPFEHLPWGDEFFMPMGMATARQILEGGREFQTGPSLPEGEPEEQPNPEDQPAKAGIQDSIPKISDAQRQYLWRKWASSWIGLEKEYRQTIRNYFARQQRELFARLRSVIPAKAGIQKVSADEVIMRVVFDLRMENRKLRVINRVFFERGALLGTRQSLSEIQGLSGESLETAAKPITDSAAVQHAMAVSSTKLEDVNTFTRDRVAQTLREGLESGEGLPQLTERMENLFGFSRSRAKRIARTQTAGAVSTGRHEGMKASGVHLKAWITSQDDAVRPAHRAAGEQYADGIPIDQPFIVDGESLQYPGDPSGSAANIINCRCLQIARLNHAADFQFLHYKSAGTDGIRPTSDQRPETSDS